MNKKDTSKLTLLKWLNSMKSKALEDSRYYESVRNYPLKRVCDREVAAYQATIARVLEYL